VCYPERAVIAIAGVPDSIARNTDFPISIFQIGFRFGFWQSHSHGVFRRDFWAYNGIRPKDSV
jgi:hypothetical protein